MISDPYRAQRILPLWDQGRLQSASALVIGVGGLGTPAALYLSAMGIGRMILCDPDTIAIENLHRQPLYTPHHVGQPKVQVLSEHLRKLRPDLSIETYQEWADETFLREVGVSTHIWIDGTDNLPSRLLIDEMAHRLKKPWVYGAIYQWEGQVVLWDGLRYRDYFGEGVEGPSCSEAGVLGAIPGIIGSWQAALAAMYLTIPHATPIHRLFRINLLTGQTQSLELLPHTPTPVDTPTHPQPLTNTSPNLPLEMSIEELGDKNAYQWIDVRAEPHPPLPFPHAHRPWYGYDQWDLSEARPIVLVCETGTQSRTIAYALRKKLHRSDIVSLRGGARKLLSLPS